MTGWYGWNTEGMPRSRAEYDADQGPFGDEDEEERMECPLCGGSGGIPEDSCRQCRGRGWVVYPF